MQPRQLIAALAGALVAALIGYAAARTVTADSSPQASPSSSSLILTPATVADPTAYPSSAETPPASGHSRVVTAVEVPELALDNGPGDVEPQPDYFALAESFAADFGAAHESRDLGHLLDTLHPRIPSAFGGERCEAYVSQTLGSISDMVVLIVDRPTTFELLSPSGDLVFDNALPVYGEWAITSTGERMTFAFHLVLTDEGPRWLTTCGIPEPAAA